MAIEKQVAQALLPAHQVATSNTLRAQRKTTERSLAKSERSRRQAAWQLKKPLKKPFKKPLKK
jgi:hypothetical protein